MEGLLWLTLIATGLLLKSPHSTCECFQRVDLVFVLDSSTSVGNENFGKMLDFVKNFLQATNIDGGEVRVGIATYSTEARIEFNLKDYTNKNDLLKAVNNISWQYGSTNTADALLLMHDTMFKAVNGDRADVPNICIVVADGLSNINYGRTIPEADAARKKGIHIYAVGVGLHDLSEVDGIANKPSSRNVFSVNNFDELEILNIAIFESTCAVTTVATPTTTLSFDEDVEPARPRPKPTTTTTTTTMMPTTTISECFQRVDLVFVLDSSTSVGHKNFGKMLDFVINFLQATNIDGGEVRVGIATYSTGARIEFNLKDYTNKNDLLKAVDNISWQYGSTNTADALLLMHDTMFTAVNGDRADVPNICIVVADGLSNINYGRTIPEADAARKKGIHIYAVGVGLHDLSEVNGIANKPSSRNAFSVNNFDELEGLNNTIFESVCAVTTVATPTTTLSFYGFEKVDLVFILDSSTSVSRSDFHKMLKFCKDFLKKFDIDSGSVRVGILSYSTEVHDHFFLNAYDTSTDMFNAIDKISWIFGSTNTADAIRDMREKYFSFANGDRWDARNIAVILTDGVSNINANRLQDEARQAKNEGIHIYAIGIGLSDVTELNQIASVPASENTFIVNNFDELKDLDERIFGSLFPISSPRPTRTTTTITTRKPSTAKPNKLNIYTFVEDVLLSRPRPKPTTTITITMMPTSTSKLNEPYR
ncbi:collagen alpha-1(XII) chain-like isoform X2 [Saccostrea cucullata]|uniref:collagen alpha-1(XII) chain-like isoform X2 n=1 Tax=Saccostrea cuccullata TaxID=36930 RepID=UPI002ED1173F